MSKRLENRLAEMARKAAQYQQFCRAYLGFLDISAKINQTGTVPECAVIRLGVGTDRLLDMHYAALEGTRRLYPNDPFIKQAIKCLYKRYSHIFDYLRRDRRK